MMVEYLVGAAILVAAMSIGGGVYEFTVVDPAWPRRPDIVQPGHGGISRKRFWIAIHCLFELLLVAAILAAWPLAAVRAWLLAALACHAIMRIWSAFDFIPKALAFERAPPAEISLADAQRWTARSRFRLPLDLLTIAALIAALCGIEAGR